MKAFRKIWWVFINRRNKDVRILIANALFLGKYNQKMPKIPHPKHQKPERKVQEAAVWNEWAMEIVACEWGGL